MRANQSARQPTPGGPSPCDATLIGSAWLHSALGCSRSMSVLPDSKEEWFTTLLLPFKVWIVVAWPAVKAARYFLYPQAPLRWEFRALSEPLALTYFFCGFALLVAAACSSNAFGRRDTLGSLLYALAGFAIISVSALCVDSPYKSAQPMPGEHPHFNEASLARHGWPLRLACGCCMRIRTFIVTAGCLRGRLHLSVFLCLWWGGAL